MKIPFINRKTEGEVFRNGLNWDRDKATSLMLAFYLHFFWSPTFVIWLRRRSDFTALDEQGNKKAKRYLFHVSYQSRWARKCSEMWDLGIKPPENATRKIRWRFFEAVL